MFKISEIIYELTVNENLAYEDVLSAIKSAIKIAYKKTYGNAKNCVIKILPDSISVFEKKTVVEEEYSERTEIEFADARKLFPDCKLGDLVYIPFDCSHFSRLGVLYGMLKIYENTNISDKESLIQNLKNEIEKQENGYSNKSKTVSHLKWFSYFDNPLNPRNKIPPKTKAEEEIESMYNGGYYEDFDPFSFHEGESEDDYGENSWS